MFHKQEAVAITDEYMKTKYRTVLSKDQTWIHSLPTFGHATNNKAELPLIDHYHRDCMECVILVNGIQNYTASSVNYTLFGRDVFITQPNEIHSTGKSPQSVNELLWFQIDLSSADHFLDLPDREAYHLYQALLHFETRQLQLSSSLIQRFLESFYLLEGVQVGDKIKGHALFVFCLIEMLEAKSKTECISQDIFAAKEYIHSHIYDTIDMTDLLYVSGLSDSRFKQKFNEQIGMSPREYINMQKIEKAKSLLQTTNQSITDIAFLLGFSTSNYFTVVFKQFTGYSPKEFRRDYQVRKEL